MNDTKLINNKPLTKCSSNKGFSGNSGILPRIKICVGGQGRSPHSLTTATLTRYRVIVEYSKPNKKIVSREKNKLLKLVIYASFNDLLCIFAQWKIIQAEKNT